MMRRVWLGLCGLILLACAQVAPMDAQLVRPNAPVYAYAFNVKSQDVTIIDTATNEVVATKPRGASVRWLSNEQDFWDGRLIWTYDLVEGQVHLIAIDPVAMRVERRLEIGAGPAHSVQLSPDRRNVMVNVAGENVIAIVDRETLSIVRKVPTGLFPCDLDLAPGGRIAYFPERDQATVAKLDLGSFEIVERTSLPEGSKPHMLRVAPDGGSVWVLTAVNGTNEVLDPDTLAVVDSRKLGKVPVTNAWTPDGRHAYVTHFGDPFISVVDATSYREVKRIQVGKQIANVAFRPDGRYAYATVRGENKVVVIDTARREVVKELAAGEQPFGLVVMSPPEG